MAKRNAKIIKYKKPRNLNVGIVLFAAIFVYLVASVVMYLSRTQIHVYEVTEGSLASYSDYTALILREETVSYSESAGYINFYVRDGRRVGVGDLVYTIDETGQTLEELSQDTGESSLSSEDLQRLKTELLRYTISYDSMNFSDVYDMKNGIQSSLLEYLNAGALEELSSMQEDAASAFAWSYAQNSGVVSQVLDGLEGLTADQVNADSFDSSAHPQSLVSSGQAMENGAAVYKTVTSEDWQLVFPITEEDIARFGDASALNFTFRGTHLNASGAFSTYTAADGSTYGVIAMDRYMVQFVDDRYVDIQIETENVQGLKIPVSSVVYKSFYTVPRSYLTESGELLVETTDAEGNTAVSAVTPVTVSGNEEYCYLDAARYQAGQAVILQDSNERYTLGATEELTGVYNINRGYAVFRRVEILEESNEYYIVSTSGSSLSVYDHIVLDSSAVSENDIIYY